MPRSNPHKANQFKIDPRQKLCWDLYIDPMSETFSNAKRSAIRAGYDDSYAEHIMQASWFCVKQRQFTMRNDAELALGQILNMPIELVQTSNDDKHSIKSTVVTDLALLKIKAETAKFVVERLGGEDWTRPKASCVKSTRHHSFGYPTPPSRVLSLGLNRPNS
jgi:hypothetical protein